MGSISELGHDKDGQMDAPEQRDIEGNQAFLED